MALRFLVYISRLVDPAGPQVVPQIVRTARANNAIRGISGALIFDGEQFCQYLEGDPDEVVRVFSAIEADPRHTDLRVLVAGLSRERRFEQWSMAYVFSATPDTIPTIGQQAGPAVADSFASALAFCDADA